MDDFSRVEWPDSGGNHPKYGVMVPKFGSHVGEAGAMDEHATTRPDPYVPRMTEFGFGPDGDQLRMQAFLKACAREAEANANKDELTDFGQNSYRKSPILSTAPSASLNSRPKWMVQSSGLDDGVTICPPPPDLHVPSSLETWLRDESSTPHDIPLQELKEITDNFSDDRILGRGGFGVVYKGVLRNGDTIAVKRIVSSLMPGQQKQFESEVYHLMMLKHPNVVRCVGYCYEIQNACLEFNGKYVFAETAERLLCMEYMPKGSLDKFLSDESSGLDWSTRYNIIEGICHGLCHLHVQMNKPILHLDLKPANILLDDDMVPKITDFGLSRLLDQQQTICTSSCDGTFGYMAPEFLHGGTITPKSDIFSLGVIILEVVTGHRDYPDVTTTPSDDFTELTIRKWRDVLERSPGYRSLGTDCEQIKRCIQVGLMCVNSDRTKRPAIAKVISMLQGSE